MRKITGHGAFATLGRVALVLTLAAAVASIAVDSARAYTLDEALKTAESSNPTYRRAVLAVEQANLTLTRQQADSTVRAGALALEQAKGAKETAEVAADAAHRKLRLDVRRAYYTLISSQQQLQVATEARQQATEQLRIIQGRRRSGAVTDLDVLNATRALAEAESGVARATTSVRLAELTFADLLVLPAESVVKLDSSPEESKAQLPKEDEAIAEALERSPEVKQARTARDAARLSQSLADNDYTPELARKAAAAKVADATLAVQETEQRISFQVRRTLAEAVLADTTVELAVKTTTAAAEGYRTAQVRFNAGVATADDLLSAQVRLFQARQAELQARLDRDLARATLFSLVGE